MSPMILLLLHAIGALCDSSAHVCASGAVSFTQSFSFELDADHVLVDYTINCVPKTVAFTLTTKSPGWFAIGFTSFEPRMVTSDIYMAAVYDNGTVTAHNVYAAGHYIEFFDDENIVAYAGKYCARNRLVQHPFTQAAGTALWYGQQ
jgi:hypothetical protein